MNHRNPTLLFAATLLGTALSPVWAGQITLPTLPTYGATQTVFIHPASDNTGSGGGTVSAAQLAPGSAVTGITIWGNAFATMGSDPTHDLGNGLFTGRTIFDFDFSDTQYVGQTLASDAIVPVSWDFTLHTTGPDGSPVAGIVSCEMEPLLLFSQGWADSLQLIATDLVSDLHTTGSMSSNVPAGWTFAGRTVFQFYVTWIAPAGSTLTVDVPQGSSIDFGSVNAAASTSAPEPATLLLGLPFLAMLARRRKRISL